MDIIQSNEENMKRQSDQPHPPPALPQKCPRCDSANTKFCYYNNYSLSQPRYFCKACRRYWTHGGTLRNVPIGGGCRKNKRSKALATASSSNNEVARTQLLTGQPAHDTGMISGQSLRSLPPILSSFAAMQALPAVNQFGGNMALLQGMSFQPLRSQPAPQQLPAHDDQFMSQRPSWTQRYINGGYWGGNHVDGGDQAGPSYGQNQWSMANNHQGFNPPQ